MRLHGLVMPVLLLVGFGSGHAIESDPGADEVLERYVAESGGVEAFRALGGVRFTGFYTGSHLRFYDADRLPWETVVGSATEWHRVWPNSDITETLLAERGFRFYPQDGGTVRDMSRMEHAFLLRETPLALIEWEGLWESMERLPDSEFEGEPTDVVEMRSGELVTTRHFSKATGLLLASTATSGAVTMRITYSEYATHGAVTLPGRVIVDAGPEEHHVYDFETFEPNARIDASVFEADERPTPNQ